MIATVKIIPFSVSQETLRTIEGLEPRSEIRVFPFIPARVGLIQTYQPDFKMSLLEKTTRITEQRLAALGATLCLEKRCPHDTVMATATLKEVLDHELDWVFNDWQLGHCRSKRYSAGGVARGQR